VSGTKSFAILAPWPLFPAARFVHPDLNLRAFVAVATLKLSLLGGAAIAQLVRDRIPEGDSRELSTIDTEWAKSLWTTAFLLADPSSDKPDLSRIPLVRTTQGRTHVSLQSCTGGNSSMLVAPVGEDAWLRPVMEHLGATCFKIDAFPDELRQQFKDRHFGLESILRFVSASGTVQLRNAFATLQTEIHERFAVWVVDRLKRKSKKQLQSLGGVGLLPIWTAYRGSDEAVLCRISDMEMLPSGVDLDDVQTFMRGTSITRFAQVLKHLGKEPVTIQHLRDMLVIPFAIGDDLLPAFKRLLRFIISHKSQDGRAPMVPNRSGHFVRASTLYSRSQALFVAAFASEPQRFIHSHLEDMQSGLVQFGLEHTINVDTFRACAEAIARDVGGQDLLRRAATVFHFYSTRLPMLVGGNRHRWRDLDGIRFIPASPQRRQNVSWSEEFAPATSGNTLHSPAQMLRPELQGIAWTQRALFRVEPSQNLLVADLELGVPTPREVVS
jgi:hypothetical protein